LIWAVIIPGYVVIHYESGGYAHSFQVVVVAVDSSKKARAPLGNRYAARDDEILRDFERPWPLATRALKAADREIGRTGRYETGSCG